MFTTHKVSESISGELIVKSPTVKVARSEHSCNNQSVDSALKDLNGLQLGRKTDEKMVFRRFPVLRRKEGYKRGMWQF